VFKSFSIYHAPIILPLDAIYSRTFAVSKYTSQVKEKIKDRKNCRNKKERMDERRKERRKALAEESVSIQPNLKCVIRNG